MLWRVFMTHQAARAAGTAVVLPRLVGQLRTELEAEAGEEAMVEVGAARASSVARRGTGRGVRLGGVATVAHLWR